MVKDERRNVNRRQPKKARPEHLENPPILLIATRFVNQQNKDLRR